MYYFSSAQEPSDNTSVYGSSDKFALAMFQRSAPALLAYGGTYANTKELNIENILLFAFPFGIGGPKMKRKVKVSCELCIQHYMRLSLPQFMEGPKFLVMNHILNRQMSYKTGVSSAQEPSDNTSMYGSSDKFALAMFHVQHQLCWRMVALTPTRRS